MELTIGKVLGAALALISAGCGIKAAGYSAAAGRVPVTPHWGSDHTRQPGEAIAALEGWNAASLVASDKKAARLNTSAATWAAWSAIFAILAAAVGVLT